MNMNKERIDALKARYPVGTRLELIYMSGEDDMQKGIKGTVDFVDDIGQLQMTWDNGRSLALNSDCDIFRKLTQEEIEAENQALEQSSGPNMSM